MSTERKGPLSRFKVIDLTRARAGPTAARHFADWGADVIKVEMPAGADLDPLGGSRDGPDFFNLHRNKRSITLNLKLPEGAAVLKKLAATADVLIENYRPDVKHRLGIDYETLRAINPRLVYVSLSGFGQDGPYANRPGFDQIAQGMGGLMSITGLPGQGPVRVGIPIADLSSGNYAAMGAFIALARAGGVRRGAVGADLAAAGADLHARLPGRALERGAPRCRARPATITRPRSRPACSRPPTGTSTSPHPASISSSACARRSMRRGCCRTRISPTATKRSKNRVRLNAEIGSYTKRYRSDELVEKLNAAGVPSGPIYTIDQMFADPQVKHVGMAVPMPHPTRDDAAVVNQAVVLSRTAPASTALRPKLGEHTDEVLADLGYDSAAIADLRRRKVV